MVGRRAVVLAVASLAWLAFIASHTNSGAVAQAVDKVVINELMYHPASDIDGEEYVELINTGPSSVDLAGWFFSDGFDFTFPAGTVLPAGSYLVIAHDPQAVAGRYGLRPDALLGPFTAKRLSNGGERVALSNASGDLVDEVTYGDDSPWPGQPDGQGPSLELINPSFDNDGACAWAASSGQGTPGARNSVFALDIPPCVEGVMHAPVFPTSSQAVTVSARIWDNGSLAAATVFHRLDTESAFSAATMLDDGTGGDAVANDGLYTAQLPLYPAGSLVEFYVEARDAAGLTTKVPINAPEIVSPETGRPLTVGFLFLVEDTPPTSARPIYRLLVSNENWTELTTRDLYSNQLLDATFIYADQVYYNVGLRYRGESSRPSVPKSYRVNFPSAHPFYGAERLNLVADHISREALTYNLFRRAGMVASETEFVDLYVNSAYQALYLTVEQVDEAFLKVHLPGDDGGHLYRAYDGGDLSYRGEEPDNYRPYYVNKTDGNNDDYSAIIALTNALDNSPDESLQTNTQAAADMDQWLRWFALNAIVFNQEGALFMGQGDDYFLYQRPSDSRFILIPWDHDATFYYAAGDLWAPNLRIVRRILRHPPFTRLYYQNINNLMVDEFSTVTMQPLIDALPPELDSEKNQLKQFVSDRIRYLSNYFAANIPDRPLSITTNGGASFTTTQRTVVLTGECSPWRDVYVNGSAAGVTYPSIYDWRYTTPALRPRANRFEVTDRDSQGNVVHTRAITVTFDTFDGGLLDEDLTLGLEGSPYIILDNIVVPMGLTLTIEPGVTVAFAQGTSLFVEGRLLAQGTSRQPITLTRDLDTEHWGVVGIYGSRADNRLFHVVVEYPGQAVYEGQPFSGVGVYDGRLTLEDSEIRRTRHAALDLTQSTAYLRRNWVHDTVDGAGLRAQHSTVEAEDNRFNNLHGGKHGLHVSGTVGSAASAGGLLHHNLIYGVEGDCVRLDGANLPVQRNELHHCTGAGFSLYQTAGQAITNNLIHHSGVGVVIGNGAQAHLVHNTLVSNNVAGLAVNDGQSGASVVNSILWDTGTAISTSAGSSISVAYSDIEGGWTGSGEGNIDADPQFRRPNWAVYRLRESSPCIDRGTPADAALDDLLGVPRPQGAGYDMGAFEFFEYHSLYLPLVIDEA
jgi:hypothetical protein